ncbi:MAG: hypothetical protein A4E48_00021 [Methanosaeta sp. PtaU1.Bin060]|jgi:hypothetical protein|nr:hypothetical protein [Candidatus Methanosuratincola sp.]OPY55494.1 MAG: hypothetical protein A4E48_00021 [Methanosaeta sp. PtaU1.Bin060]
MAVKLRLETGDIKKYTTWCDRDVGVEWGGYQESKCGRRRQLLTPSDKECEHIDCAIYAAEFNAKDQRMGAGLMILISLLILISGIIAHDSMALFGIIGILIGIPLWISRDKDYKNNKKKAELIEFKNYGTINSIKAEKV